MNTPDPQSVGKQDLGALFGTGDRASGLAGKLTPRRTPPRDPADDTNTGHVEPTADEAVPAVTPPSQEPKAQKAPKSRKAKTAAAPRVDAPEAASPSPTAGEGPVKEHTAQVQFYVPADVLARFRARRDAEGTTGGLLLLDAIDYAVDIDADDPYALLRDLVDKTLIQAPKKKSLFDREPRIAKSNDLGPRSQLLVRIKPSEMDIITELVRETKAVDRGHLATIVISHYLENTTPQGDV